MIRTRISFDDNWLFHEGDIPLEVSPHKSVMYIQAKTERKRYGPASRSYNDGTEFYNETGEISPTPWYKVELPHDYIIKQEPKEHNNDTLGYFEYNNAWYRKHFTLPELPDTARVRLYFEGVAVHSKYYVNGCYVTTNNCGYNSFELDITDFVEFGGQNVLAVYIDTTEHEGWWYEGAGIYRHVYLDISDAVSIDCWGVFARPEKLDDHKWNLPVDVEVRNDGFTPANVRVMTDITDAQDNIVLTLSDTLSVPARAHATARLCGAVTDPLLWGIETPHLYTAKTTLVVDGKTVDVQTDRFGFRTAVFDAQKGFFLNGEHVKIQGVCCHQDYGLTGKAVPERVQRYRLELMKEMGANGYRCAHYPHHPHTMDMLDELGFLTLAETRWYDSTPEGMAQLDSLIKRDRNHPSVIFWSAGNEEPMHLTNAGRRIAKSMLYRARQLDPTRPVTTAVSNDPINCKVYDTIDIIGVNYNLEQYDGIHELYPDVPFVSTECCATGTTRGWYGPDMPSRGYVHGYDHDVNKSFVSRERTWKMFMARDWVSGGYQWAGIEHRGETVWPRLCSQSGAVDLFLNKKDAFYQNQSHWLKTPMVHLLPHWNWQGHEGEDIQVWAYTNCDRVDLYLNNEKIASADVEKWGHAEFTVPYAPGKLEAIGYNNGAEVCRDAVETTGDPVQLRLTLNSDGVRADGKDVAILTCDCIDAQGRHVPTASPYVSFDANALGTVIATGSDVCDHTPVTSPDRHMRCGLISVLVKSATTKGDLKVYAHAQGLKPATLVVELG